MIRRSTSSRAVKLDRTGFRALMDAAADGIVVIDDGGTVLDFNPAAQRMFGFSSEQIVGHNVALLMPEPDRSGHDGYIARYLRTGEKRIIGIGREVTGRRADGTTLPIHLSVGRSNGFFVGILRDLTAQKAAEEENQRLKDKLIEVDRLSLMGELAAGVAHEINQPLSAIANYAQAGERIASHGEMNVRALRKTCRDIAEQALRAGRIIRNLRTVAGQRDIVEDEVDINRAIDDVLNLVEADAAASEIHVSTEFAPGLPPIVGDATRLQQVLLNLTRNAVDAMRDGARKEKGIRIRTQRVGGRGGPRPRTRLPARTRGRDVPAVGDHETRGARRGSCGQPQNRQGARHGKDGCALGRDAGECGADCIVQRSVGGLRIRKWAAGRAVRIVLRRLHAETSGEGIAAVRKSN